MGFCTFCKKRGCSMRGGECEADMEITPPTPMKTLLRRSGNHAEIKRQRAVEGADLL